MKGSAIILKLKNKKFERKEVKEMKKIGLVVALMLVGAMIMCLPSVSSAFEVVTYYYTSAGTLYMTASSNGTTVTNKTMFRGDGLKDKSIDYFEITGSDTPGEDVTTFAYKKDGTATAKRIKGDTEEITIINAYGQNILTYDNKSSGDQMYFIGGNSAYPTPEWTAANAKTIDTDGNGTLDASVVDIQAAGGLAAYEAAIKYGLATSTNSDWDTSSGIKLACTTGKRIVSVNVYGADGSTISSGLAQSTGNVHVDQANTKYASFVTSYRKQAASGKAIGQGIKDATDPGAYITRTDSTGSKYFDPIIDVSGMLGRDANGNFTLTVNGEVKTLVVNDAKLIEQLSKLVGSTVNLTVDDLGEGGYSLFSINGY